LYPEPVEGNEPIARYLLEDRKFSITQMRVKHNAFMPANDNILSVYRIENLVHAEIMKIGKKYVAEPQAREVLAYAQVAAAVFTEQGLLMAPTAEPHPRHVDVTGWSEREANRSRAQMIAEHSTLVLK
jgi:hypothetical protein